MTILNLRLRRVRYNHADGHLESRPFGAGRQVRGGFCAKLTLGILFSCLVAAGYPQSDLEEPGYINLKHGWEYRWGDSPLDSAGIPTWTYMELDADDWRTHSELINPPGATGEYLWIRRTLPETLGADVVLYIPHVFLRYQVYVNQTLIHSNGKLQAAPENRYLGQSWTMIPLSEHFQGDRLYFRIFSEYPGYIGMMDVDDHARIGDATAIIRSMIRKGADSVVLGCLFIFLGSFAVFVFLRRHGQDAIFPISFSALSILLGSFYVFSDELTQFVVPAAWIRYYLSMISFTLFPVALYSFLEHVIHVESNRRVIRTVWQVHLLYAIGSIVLDFMNIMPLPVSNQYFLWLFISSILVSILIGFHSAISGNTEARIVIIGFMIFGLFGLHDILVGLRMLPNWHWLSHWGAFVFVLALGNIVERRYNESNRRLRSYSEELELKSKQLEDYSRTLEQRVDERTANLKDKNAQLEDTLRQLRQTQNQLVMKEKMASLGNLVAGVAHELNSPIGAVKSSADVSRRCIERLKTLLESGRDISDLRKDADFSRSLTLLQQNNEVMLLASDRVSTIVRSLKSFARLDQAEYQKFDIHEGIDSTLTLVSHETKNRIEIVRDYGAIPLISCYPDQLNQVFMNIIMNAIQAIDEEGTIAIKTEAIDDSVSIAITDNGKGIPEEQLPEIFNPGFTTKGVGVGTGLGLSISYNIIQKHHGTIEAASQVGEGTSFHIRLPIVSRNDDDKVK